MASWCVNKMAKFIETVYGVQYANLIHNWAHTRPSYTSTAELHGKAFRMGIISMKTER